MPNSVAVITFTGTPDVNDAVALKCHFKNPPYTEFTRGETFKVSRVNPGETEIEATVNDQAATYAATFITDYNGGNDFDVSVTDNVVTVKCMTSGSFDYFTSFTMTGDFATVVFLEPDLYLNGLNGDRYLINNEIWIEAGANVPTSFMTMTFQNLTSGGSGSVVIYPSPTNNTRYNIAPIIKSLFAKLGDAAGYVTNDEPLNNACRFRITLTADGLEDEMIERVFVYGGRRTNNTNQTIDANAPLRPTVMIPIWQGYDTAEYYIDDDGVMRKRLVAFIDAGLKDFKRTPKTCNLVYVKFLNQQGSYSNWLFESHNQTENNTNLGSYVRDNEVQDLGNESDSAMKLFGKIPEYYKRMINDLIVSPEIYVLMDGEYVRALSAKNTFTSDTVKRAYNVGINLDFEYRFNPSPLWSN